MAITISIIETARQLVAGIPEYLILTVDQPSTVFYTIDNTIPDPTGASLTTIIMETEPNNHLQGIIYLPRDTGFIIFNALAVGVPSTNTGVFYRSYGLDARKINRGRPELEVNKTVPGGGTGFITTPNQNTTTDGEVITAAGITEGAAVSFAIGSTGFDGYVDGYAVAISGTQVAIQPPTFDHITGYDGDGNVVSTTTLTPGQELNLLKLSTRGDIFIDDGAGLIPNDSLPVIDPRSTAILDSEGRQITTIPIETYPEDNSGYTVDANAGSIDDDFDNAPDLQNTVFTSGGIFDPRAPYIEIDGRIDGYINGSPILPGDRTIINKPYGEIRYLTKREDLGDAIRVTNGFISGGLVCPIYDYAKGQAAFYYWDSRDNRWIVSLQKITAPKYELFARRNGVVVGSVFKWITGRRQVLPA